MWTREIVEKLIELVHNAPSLWDSTCPEYRDRYKKDAELSRIATYFNLSEDVVSRKIKSLKTQFRRENRKMKEMSKTGSSAISPDKLWFGYSLMSFLLKNNVSKASSSSVQEDVVKNEDEESSSVSSVECVDEDPAHVNEYHLTETNSESSQFESGKKKFQVILPSKNYKKQKKNHDARFDEAY
ncbi:hypothetical protein Avbf_11400 [Armadillidium vulgare]|nr:hypothetical protein Avbf_11400 [Armadillidium vulgare]